MKLTPYEATGYPTYDIDLEAPPDERWKEVAQDEAFEISQLLQDVLAMGLEHAEKLPAMLRPLVVLAGKGTVRLTGRIVDLVAGCFGEDYVAEIRSIAKHACQPLSLTMLGNLAYDIFQFAGISGLGCSSYSCNIDGMPTLVRNMDWVWPRSTGRHTRLVRFHRGQESYTSVSVLGCVGVVSAFCPGKWALAVNQAPTQGTSTNVFQWPVLQRVRHVCDQMGSYRETVDALQEYRTMTPFFAHVVGTRPKQHTVISGLGAEFWRRGLKNGTVVQTNNFVGRNLAQHNGPESWVDKHGQEWIDDSFHRRETLLARLESPPTTIVEARKKILGRPVTSMDTMQQMVLQPAGGTARLWLRV